ncbi:hypothetical protein QBC35DRAFT_240164 [Podospora australis]|uniref:Uncharacterized protein n=1 Tax=Podospora australis TaxID=1536484 RepID=A0AAN7AIT9_9PEZI|nr:hypothetical protein QBC35DRAFT_240164 [Podospora australis]
MWTERGAAGCKAGSSWLFWRLDTPAVMKGKHQHWSSLDFLDETESAFSKRYHSKRLFISKRFNRPDRFFSHQTSTHHLHNCDTLHIYVRHSKMASPRKTMSFERGHHPGDPANTEQTTPPVQITDTSETTDPEQATSHNQSTQLQQTPRDLVHHFLFVEHEEEWGRYQDNPDLTLNCDNLTMEHLALIGRLSEAIGTQECQKIIRAPAIGEVMAHALWKKLSTTDITKLTVVQGTTGEDAPSSTGASTPVVEENDDPEPKFGSKEWEKWAMRRDDRIRDRNDARMKLEQARKDQAKKDDKETKKKKKKARKARKKQEKENRERGIVSPPEPIPNPEAEGSFWQQPDPPRQSGQPRTPIRTPRSLSVATSTSSTSTSSTSTSSTSTSTSTTVSTPTSSTASTAVSTPTPATSAPSTPSEADSTGAPKRPESPVSKKLKELVKGTKEFGKKVGEIMTSSAGGMGAGLAPGALVTDHELTASQAELKRERKERKAKAAAITALVRQLTPAEQAQRDAQRAQVDGQLALAEKNKAANERVPDAEAEMNKAADERVPDPELEHERGPDPDPDREREQILARSRAVRARFEELWASRRFVTRPFRNGRTVATGSASRAPGSTSPASGSLRPVSGSPAPKAQTAAATTTQSQATAGQGSQTEPRRLVQRVSFVNNIATGGPESRPFGTVVTFSSNNERVLSATDRTVEKGAKAAADAPGKDEKGKGKDEKGEGKDEQGKKENDPVQRKSI